MVFIRNIHFFGDRWLLTSPASEESLRSKIINFGASFSIWIGSKRAYKSTKAHAFLWRRTVKKNSNVTLGADDLSESSTDIDDVQIPSIFQSWKAIKIIKLPSVSNNFPPLSMENADLCKLFGWWCHIFYRWQLVCRVVWHIRRRGACRCKRLYN